MGKWGVNEIPGRGQQGPFDQLESLGSVVTPTKSRAEPLQLQ